MRKRRCREGSETPPYVVSSKEKERRKKKSENESNENNLSQNFSQPLLLRIRQALGELDIPLHDEVSPTLPTRPIFPYRHALSRHAGLLSRFDHRARDGELDAPPVDTINQGCPAFARESFEQGKGCVVDEVVAGARESGVRDFFDDEYDVLRCPVRALVSCCLEPNFCS